MRTCTANGASTEGLVLTWTSQSELGLPLERAGSPPARTGSPWNLVSAYSSFISPGLSIVSGPWGAAVMCVTPHPCLGGDVPQHR